MDKLIVLGGGSLGLLLAGKLASSGCDVVVWTRTAIQAELLASKGLALIDNDSERRLNINAIPFESAAADEGAVILLTVKQTALKPEFLRQLSIAVPAGSTLLLLQNGIGHLEMLERALPGRTLIPAVTTEGAMRVDETTVRHTGKGDFRLGDENPHDRRSLLRLERLLKQAGFSVYLSKKLVEAVMRKLLVNAVINPLTAILRIRNGELTETTARMDAMRTLFAESYDILIEFGLTGEEEELWNMILGVCSATAWNESSMLQDVLARRETEIDFINGAICRMASERGRAAPWNEAVTALVKAVQ